MKNKGFTSRSTPLVLCAAIALALPGCTTKSSEAPSASTHKPSPQPVTSSQDEVHFEEVVVTGSRTPEQSSDSVVTVQPEPRQDYTSNAPHRMEALSLPSSGRGIGNSSPLARMEISEQEKVQADRLRLQSPIQDTENYAPIKNNPVKLVTENPVSTFSVDVDTGAYANVRRFLNNDRLPPQDAVRVEELINYFNYEYQEPNTVKTPFSVSTELSKTPWNNNTWLLHVGLKGYEVPAAERPPANLVFLLDVSGSMNSPDKLPLLKKSFKLLTRQLNEDDRISIVVYAGASGVVLEPTPGDDHRTIMRALRKLQAGGSTNGAEGIELAYELADEAFIEDGINRIVLATDGDFNVGTVNFEQLKDMAERKRKSGVSLTTLGFGTGNYNDHLLEQLADAGNGNYAYIDSQQEARKVLVNEVTSTLHTIAKDVKIQIEFNPDVVSEYRLIGYENRVLNREDFKNDKVDAGEIGAGHTVTALYELMPATSGQSSVTPLRYQSPESNTTQRSNQNREEAAYIRLRYKQPDADTSTEISQPIFKNNLVSLSQASDNLRFSAAVAGFGQLLNGSTYINDFTMEDVQNLARGAVARDPHGYRHEFVELANTADLLLSEQPGGRIAQTD